MSADPDRVDAIDVGLAAIALTGAPDAASAIRIVRGWQRDASSANSAKDEIAARLAAEDARERIEIVRDMVVRGTLAPYKAWTSTDLGPLPANGVAEPWGSMPLEQLRAVSGDLERGITMPKVSTPKATGGVVTPQIEAKAKEIGVKPESLAAASREIAALTNGAASATLGG